MDAKYDGFNVSCEQDPLVRIATRLNYVRQGTPLECLRKGFARGVRHPSEYAGAAGRVAVDLTEEEVRNLEEWGSPDAPRVVTSIDGLRGSPAFSAPSQREREVTLKSRHSDEVEFEIVESAGTGLSREAFGALEDLQMGHPENGDDAEFALSLFLGPTRAVTAARTQQQQRRGGDAERRVWMLEDSLPALETNAVFDKEDLVSLFNLSDQEGRLLLALPLLTEHLAPLADNWLLCEISFVAPFVAPTLDGKTIIFYANLQRPEVVRCVQWYMRCMRQQFVFPGEEPRLKTQLFDTADTTIETCAWLAILRMEGAAVDAARLAVPRLEKVQRVTSYLKQLARRRRR